MSRLLVINPGSTSTKLAVYDGVTPLFQKSTDHCHGDLAPFASLIDQLPFRRQLVFSALEEAAVDPQSLDAVVGRGGLLHPLPGGVYAINQDMADDLKSGRYGQHASSLGSLLAWEIAVPLGIPALTADPIVVDELDEIARLSGWPEIPRKSIFHALNQKAVARLFAREQKKHYSDLNLIVVHMGGGISVGAHRKGRVVDVANALDGEGPFSVERAGGLPVGDLVRLCFSGRYQSATELLSQLVGQGGLMAYLGTKDGREVERRIAAGDRQAELVLRAMALQIAKEIGGQAASLQGAVDAILITGGLAYDQNLVDWIRERVAFIAPLHVYPGEDELGALAQAGQAALSGQEPIQEYRS